MAFSWKLAIDVGPRSLTHAEWKGWPFPFTLALTPTYRGCSPRLRGWPEWIELIETGWNSRLMVITGQASPALTLKKKQDRQSHLWLFVSLTTVILFPFPAALWVINAVFSPFTWGEGVKPLRADPEPGLRHGSSLEFCKQIICKSGDGSQAQPGNALFGKLVSGFWDVQHSPGWDRNNLPNKLSSRTGRGNIEFLSRPSCTVDSQVLSCLLL